MADSPALEYIVVMIDDIDIQNRLVHALDKTKARFSISMRETPGGVWQIPAQGEFWTAIRRGYIWYLDKKLDSGEDHQAAIDTMSPGDVRISGHDDQSTISIIGTVKINGNPIGAVQQITFESDIQFLVVELPSPPGPTITIFLNGLLVDPSLWSVMESTITFENPMGMGILTVYF